MLDNEQFGDIIKNMQFLNFQITKAKEELLNYKSENVDVLKTEFCGVIRKFNNSEDQYNDCKRFIRIYDEYMLYRERFKSLNTRIETLEKNLQEVIELAYDFDNFDISKIIQKNIVIKAESIVKCKPVSIFNIDVAREVRDILSNLFFDQTKRYHQDD